LIDYFVCIYIKTLITKCQYFFEMYTIFFKSTFLYSLLLYEMTFNDKI